MLRAQHFPSLSAKGGHGGGEAGGKGRMQGCVRAQAGNQMTFSPNPRLLTSLPGWEPTRLNCAHLVAENSTATALKTSAQIGGTTRNPPGFSAQKGPRRPVRIEKVGAPPALSWGSSQPLLHVGLPQTLPGTRIPTPGTCNPRVSVRDVHCEPQSLPVSAPHLHTQPSGAPVLPKAAA